ncbi:MAG: hypothetical protein Q7R85_03435 [bacterium]|nr:hypothetical protein [bacterium]
MAETFIQLIGWVGTLLIVLAYFLNSHKKIGSANLYYQLLNLIGAICLGINVLYLQAWPSLVLQIIWAMIAISVLVKKPRQE